MYVCIGSNSGISIAVLIEMSVLFENHMFICLMSSVKVTLDEGYYEKI